MLEKKHIITLEQFLKYMGITQTGGQAKLAIQDGEVSVNGMVETRRKRKLFEGDSVEIDNEIFTVDLMDDL